MKRTLLVLALAVLSSAGCRAIESNFRGQSCGAPCADGCCEPCADGCCTGCGDACGEPCHVTNHRLAPRPAELVEGMPRLNHGGNLEEACPGGNGYCFDRYCGHNCGPGYHPGPYDCSAVGSPHWGCTGHRHPQGYVNGHKCMCQGEIPGHCPQPGPHCRICGHGYCCACCGPPAPGCLCNSGDQNHNCAPGPPTGQTAYPYYTLRGPRDFLLGNPPSIGPY